MIKAIYSRVRYRGLNGIKQITRNVSTDDEIEIQVNRRKNDRGRILSLPSFRIFIKKVGASKDGDTAVLITVQNIRTGESQNFME